MVCNSCSKLLTRQQVRAMDPTTRVWNSAQQEERDKNSTIPLVSWHMVSLNWAICRIERHSDIHTLKAITVVKNSHIAIINLSTLCCMGVVAALSLLRFSSALWEHVAAQGLWAVAPTCHSLWGGGYGRNKTHVKVMCQCRTSHAEFSCVYEQGLGRIYRFSVLAALHSQ